jgi:O-antigen/teichoic acid export membrane protein
VFNSSGFKRYFANTAWLMLERVVRMGLNFFVSIYVIRYLGPDDFGLLSYAISFVGLFAALAGLGLEGILVHELVKNPRQQNDLLGTSLVMLLSASILTVVAILSINTGLLTHDAETLLILLIIAGSLFFQSFNIIDLHFQARVESRFPVQAQIVQALLGGALKITLVVLDAPLVSFAWATLADYILLSVSLLLAYHQRGFTLTQWRVKPALGLALLKQSWPLMLSGVFIAFYMKIDQVMLKYFINDKAVGEYAAGVKLVEAWYFVPMIISKSLFPAIIHAKQSGNREHYQKRLQQLYALMVWMALLIAIPGSFLAEPLILFFYGSAYSESGHVLMWYIWASVLIFFGVARGKWVVVEDQQIYTLIYLAGGALTNIACNYFMIPVYGVMGAVYATLITVIVSTLIIPFALNALQRQQIYMFFQSFIFPFKILLK